MNKILEVIKFIQNIRITYGGGLAIVDIMVWGWFAYCLILSVLGYCKITK